VRAEIPQYDVRERVLPGAGSAGRGRAGRRAQAAAVARSSDAAFDGAPRIRRNTASWGVVGLDMAQWPDNDPEHPFLTRGQGRRPDP